MKKTSRLFSSIMTLGLLCSISAFPQEHPYDGFINPVNHIGKRPVRHKIADTMSTPAINDSCTTYKYDHGDFEDAGGWAETCYSVLLLNVFPCHSDSSGVITSFIMKFTSAVGSTSQPCIIYVYGSDQTTILGKSDPFINSGAAWPDATWDTVHCPDIPYSGVFYAMIDYSIDSLPQKNYLCLTCDWVSCYEPGAGIYLKDGLWTWADNFIGVYCQVTFLMRANVCKHPPEGVHSVSPGRVLVYPNPAESKVKIVSPFEIQSVELINSFGQPVFSSYDLNEDEITIDVSAIDQGLYIAKLLTAHGAISEKITVLH
jgi:hypothetical protein